jgi:serine/threonine-protein kinase HipA
MFMKAQVLFWLLGAIDGHAKNFSIYLLPRGGYRMTPLYDVMSAYPIVAKKDIHPREMKMAMSVDGKNKHYSWNGILRRHWSSMSRKARFPEEELESIINELLDPMEAVISSIASTLPAAFPSGVAEPIFSGMREAKLKIA